LKNYLVAIVVPKEEELKNLAQSMKIEGNLEEICNSEEIVNQIIEEMNSCAKRAKLLPFEMAKKIVLDPKSFGQNDLMTPSLKLKRHEAKAHYSKEIETMYAKPVSK